MPVNIGIVKVTASGEQITVHASQANAVTGEWEYATVEEMAQAMKPAFDFVDDRTEEMNMRMLTALTLEKYCMPEEWVKCREVMEILFGRVDAATIAHRWQSRVEEAVDFAQFGGENNGSTYTE